MLGASAAALVVTALGAPVAAADTTGTLAIVNGRPGPKVDICIGPREMASKVPYGAFYRKSVISTGPKLIRFFKANRRTCGGQLLARWPVNIVPGYDHTIVLTRRPPSKIVDFDNVTPNHLGEIPPRGALIPAAIFAWANASELPANFHYTVWDPNPEVPIPAVNRVFPKGDRIASGAPPNIYVRLRATKLEDPTTLAQRSAYFKVSRRYEWILVGTNHLNMRFVLVDRGVSDLSP